MKTSSSSASKVASGSAPDPGVGVGVLQCGEADRSGAVHGARRARPGRCWAAGCRSRRRAARRSAPGSAPSRRSWRPSGTPSARSGSRPRPSDVRLGTGEDGRSVDSGDERPVGVVARTEHDGSDRDDGELTKTTWHETPRIRNPGTVAVRHDGAVASPNAIRDILQQAARAIGEAPTVPAFNDWARRHGATTGQALMRRSGYSSWPEALRDAGLDPADRNRSRRAWSEEQLHTAIRACSLEDRRAANHPRLHGVASWAA